MANTEHAREAAHIAYMATLNSDWARRYPWDLDAGEDLTDPRTKALNDALDAYEAVMR